MKHYQKMLEMGCFNREDLIKLVGTPEAAASVIYDYQRKGYIERVKRDCYAVISLESSQPVFSRYQIGTALYSDAYISHHSAFEVYGCSNQVFHECYVATASKFRNFSYNGIYYQRVEAKQNAEVISEGTLRVASIEQTIVDSIRDYEKIAGLEEVLRCIILLPGVDEDKLMYCLKQDNNGFLYQKCGYIFEELQNEFRLSDHFYDECMAHSSNAKRYLLKNRDETIYNSRWKLYTPSRLKKLIDKGVTDYAAI